MFTFAALIEYSAAAYLEKRKNFLQSKIQSPNEIEIGVVDMDCALKDNANSLLLTLDKAEQSTTGPRVRKKSYMSKRMNDPKLIEVTKAKK